MVIQRSTSSSEAAVKVTVTLVDCVGLRLPMEEGQQESQYVLNELSSHLGNETIPVFRHSKKFMELFLTRRSQYLSRPSSMFLACHLVSLASSSLSSRSTYAFACWSLLRVTGRTHEAFRERHPEIPCIVLNQNASSGSQPSSCSARCQWPTAEALSSFPTGAESFFAEVIHRHVSPSRDVPATTKY